ncbi:hypothetical protein HELRODRAFT_184146 [Helobdella robusta]|uniref:C2H2-type domain-containing protein n=1 Tax=Helobdella robusta TaxID=6412 RepID=T1FKN7_HELRO|nr:hypothetical protein HELRODRAFT_184146 [Helobdella robusta]ESO07078.1 hypothetical protein HELRODRAFT_184146 [Helobdella robusta]
MKPDQKRVSALLIQTVSLLCRNGLHFDRSLRIQGLLGITIDEKDVFVVQLDDTLLQKQLNNPPTNTSSANVSQAGTCSKSRNLKNVVTYEDDNNLVRSSAAVKCHQRSEQKLVSAEEGSSSIAIDAHNSSIDYCASVSSKDNSEVGSVNIDNNNDLTTNNLNDFSVISGARHGNDDEGGIPNDQISENVNFQSSSDGKIHNNSNNSSRDDERGDDECGASNCITMADGNKRNNNNIDDNNNNRTVKDVVIENDDEEEEIIFVKSEISSEEQDLIEQHESQQQLQLVSYGTHNNNNNNNGDNLLRREPQQQHHHSGSQFSPVGPNYKFNYHHRKKNNFQAGIENENNIFSQSTFHGDPLANLENSILAPTSAIFENFHHSTLGQEMIKESVCNLFFGAPYRWTYTKYKQMANHSNVQSRKSLSISPHNSSSLALTFPDNSSNNPLQQLGFNSLTAAVAATGDSSLQPLQMCGPRRRSNLKTVVCQYPDCGKTFCHSCHLYRHQRLKHGRRFGVVAQTSFHCQISGCGKVFYRRASLVNHNFNVHNIGPPPNYNNNNNNSNNNNNHSIGHFPPGVNIPTVADDDVIDDDDDDDDVMGGVDDDDDGGGGGGFNSQSDLLG